MKFTFAPESSPLDGYTIKRGIRRGGFGEVYYALSDAGKEVALKLLQQNMDVELRGVRQCLNLKHPNLVTIFDIRTDADGDHWVVMEYVSGRTLDEVLAEHPSGAPLGSVEQWLSGIVAGIDYLHDRGIVHRDLKPANIHLENGIIKTGDVGLSKFISPSRRSAQTQSVGTVYYMAPEVAHGRYGREVDVYSLAVMLFEMLTGRVPFDGETTGEILMKHLSSQPDLSGLAEPLRPVLSRGLEKDPQRRTPTAGMLLDEFRSALAAAQGRPVAAAPAPAPAPPRDEGFRAVADKARLLKSKLSKVPPIPKPHVRAAADGTRIDAWWDENWPRELVRWSKVAIPVLLAFVIIVPQLTAGLVVGGIKALFVSGIFGAIAYGTWRFAQTTWQFMTGTVNDARALASRTMERHREQRAVRAAQHQHAAPAREEHAAAPPPVRQMAKLSAGDLPPGHGQRPLRARHTRGCRLGPSRRGAISTRQRLAEASGSMAAAAFCTALITLGLYVFAGTFAEPVHAAFFGTVTLLAAWAAMVPAKLWEGRGSDPLVRRLLLLVVGAGVGAGAYYLDEALLITLPQQAFQAGPPAYVDTIGPHDLLDSAGQPTLAGYVVFFAALFGLRQWWRHADSFRPKRLRIFSVLATAMLAFIIVGIWAFPSYWGLLWAAAASCVVQLASVWIPEEDRYRYAAGEVG